MKTEKAIAAALEPIVDEFLALEATVKAISLTPGPAGPEGAPGAPGAPGEAPTPEAVAAALRADEAFTASLKGLDGKGVTVEEVLKALDLTALKGADGKDGKDGQDGKGVTVEEVLKALDLNALKGADGKDGQDGVDGTHGEDGQDGKDGAGIEAKAYIPGQVYREGAVVTANIGQYFRAKKDTATSPDDREFWERVGTSGLRHRGGYDKDTPLEEGDIVTKDYGAFMFTGGKLEMLCGRGQKGDRGAVGPEGTPGRDGADGSVIVGAQVSGFKAILMVQDGKGNLDHVEMDFAPAFDAAVRSAVLSVLEELGNA